MTNREIVNKTEYLLLKYLEKNRAAIVISDIKKASKRGVNIGKEVLYILSSEKLVEFEIDDKKLLKEIAFNFGI